jgi:hypothetical protein
MAGFEGSKGGVTNNYQQFVYADIESGIAKYQALLTQIPDKEKDTKSMYQKMIRGLQQLQQEMKPEGELELIIRK